MAMSVGDRREGEPVSEINTTPLIDVMLVLLVMLIIALPPQRHAIKLDTPVPCKGCEKDDTLPDPVTIAVDFDGRIKWNNVEVSRAELDQRLAAEGKRAIQPEIHIAPNRIAKYGDVAHVMAAAQRNKLARMGVVGGT
jgi:biopolymer transport protein ExbD